ncbi:MAG: proton-conducting transporter membrane subunit, partial [Calditrichaceae bacterium]
AFFKALLFLAAGVGIYTHHHEHNMFKMGGVRKQLPVTFWTFLIGSASLAALPLITAGFFSKDQIIWDAYSSTTGGFWLWAGAYFGAFITAYYTFRMVFVTFYGKAKMEAHHLPKIRKKVPLIVLAILSVVGGYIELPHTMGHFTPFSDLLKSALPEVNMIEALKENELLFQIITGVTGLAGIYLAYFLFLRKPEYIKNFTKFKIVDALKRFWFSGWAFDWLYDRIFVKPVVWLSEINKNDFIDNIYTGIAGINKIMHKLFVYTQNGNIRWYAMGITIGSIITIYIVVFL